MAYGGHDPRLLQIDILILNKDTINTMYQELTNKGKVRNLPKLHNQRVIVLARKNGRKKVLDCSLFYL